MKNFFCVGQKVIMSFHNRETATITKILASGQIELDNGFIVYPDRVQEVEEYLDPTNYFFHHSRFATGQDMARDGFDDLMFVLEERDALEEFEKANNSTLPRFHSFLDNREKEANEKIEKGLMIKRTAEHNLCQWSSGEVIHVVAQHMPFLNPENCIDYVK